MDPITTAIIAAITAGIAAGSTDVTKKAIVDAYNGLKEMIIKKFGKSSDLTDAIKRFESKPESESRKGVVKEEVEAAQAGKDNEILEAANKLLENLKEWPDGNKHIQVAQGSYIAQADRGGTATVSVNKPTKD